VSEGQKLFMDAKAALDRMMTDEEREATLKVFRIAEELAAKTNADIEAMFRESGLIEAGYPVPYMWIDFFIE
jgi:hypothetical protein